MLAESQKILCVLCASVVKSFRALLREVASIAAMHNCQRMVAWRVAPQEGAGGTGTAASKAGGGTGMIATKVAAGGVGVKISCSMHVAIRSPRNARTVALPSTIALRSLFAASPFLRKCLLVRSFRR